MRLTLCLLELWVCTGHIKRLIYRLFGFQGSPQMGEQQDKVPLLGVVEDSLRPSLTVSALLTQSSPSPAWELPLAPLLQVLDGNQFLVLGNAPAHVVSRTALPTPCKQSHS